MRAIPHVCKLLQLLANIVSQTPTGTSPLDTTRGLPSPRAFGL